MTSAHTPLPFRDALLAMLGIGLVNMLVALDQTVVSTALPSGGGLRHRHGGGAFAGRLAL